MLFVLYAHSMIVASSPSSVAADLEAHSGTVASSPSSVVAASVFAVFVSEQYGFIFLNSTVVFDFSIWFILVFSS
ncbi:DNA-helicase [Sesbania bispinosa]|nr:DNA-helicase [Sesbania bispinosa]